MAIAVNFEKITGDLENYVYNNNKNLMKINFIIKLIIKQT
jgi:hypothetical protein